jgi:hypothetical protein
LSEVCTYLIVIPPFCLPTGTAAKAKDKVSYLAKIGGVPEALYSEISKWKVLIAWLSASLAVLTPLVWIGEPFTSISGLESFS